MYLAAKKLGLCHSAERPTTAIVRAERRMRRSVGMSSGMGGLARPYPNAAGGSKALGESNAVAKRKARRSHPSGSCRRGARRLAGRIRAERRRSGVLAVEELLVFGRALERCGRRVALDRRRDRVEVA